jgi:hypothetical protein
MNSSLNQDRHQALQKFLSQLPLVCSPEKFSEILEQASSLGILKRISRGRFNWAKKNFGEKARVITNISNTDCKYFKYAGPIFLKPDSYKTYETLEWQVFDALRKLRQTILNKERKTAKHIERIEVTHRLYDELLSAKDCDLTENKLKEYLTAAQELRIIAESDSQPSTGDYIYYKFPVEQKQNGARVLIEKFFIYIGPNDLDSLKFKFYCALKRFKRLVLNKIHQEREKIRQERIQQNQAGRHVSIGGSRKCFKAWHAGMKGELDSEKDKRQRKWEKKQRKWNRKREKLQQEEEKYLRGLKNFDDEE